MIGEIIGGELIAQPRPHFWHGSAASNLFGELYGPFQRRRNGPGGWIFVVEPELHLGLEVVVPDIAGWRTQRMPALPDAAAITLAPDWVCETLSPSNRAYDLGPKQRIYAAQGVGHLWYLDYRARTLDAFENVKGAYEPLATFTDDSDVAIAPFEAASFSLTDVWPTPVPPAAPATHSEN